MDTTTYLQIPTAVLEMATTKRPFRMALSVLAVSHVLALLVSSLQPSYLLAAYFGAGLTMVVYKKAYLARMPYAQRYSIYF